MKDKSEIAEVLEEAAELLARFNRPTPSSWRRDLQVIGLLLVVHLAMMGPEVTTEEQLGEVVAFLEAAFQMGVAGAINVELDADIGSEKG